MKSRLFILLLSAAGIVGCNKDTTAPNSTSPNSTVRADKPNSGTYAPEDTRKDNTAVNQRDRSPDAKSPIDQNENQKDVDTTANIRKRVVDTDMSTNAKNSKIITQDGKVTLRGPVATEDEKKQIEQIAVDVAGAGNVDNQLEVQP